MTDQVKVVILCAVAVLLLIICVKRGYSNGFVLEIRKLVGVIVALVTIVLIVALKGAFSDKAYGAGLVIGVSIVLLGLAWKFVKLVIGLLSGLADLPVIEWLDSLLGAVAGAAECAMIVWAAIHIYRAVTGA